MDGTDEDFEWAVPMPTSWAVACPWCGAEIEIDMAETNDASFVGAMDGFPGNSFATCSDPKCDCRIEIASVRVEARSAPIGRE